VPEGHGASLLLSIRQCGGFPPSGGGRLSEIANATWPTHRVAHSMLLHLEVPPTWWVPPTLSDTKEQACSSANPQLAQS